MKRIILLAVSNLLLTTSLMADEVNDSNITTFTNGTPAVASEVNGNFAELRSAINDNDSRIDTLTSGSLILAVDCGENAEALANAISNSNLALALDLTVTGTCDPVVVNRDHVQITGPATITSDGDGNFPLTISGGTNVVLTNLTLDAEDNAEMGLDVAWESEVVANGITISGATDSNIRVVKSTLKMSGTNNIAAENGAIALSVVANSLTYIMSGSTTLSSLASNMGGCGLEVETNASFASDGGATLNITGRCITSHENSTIILNNATVNVLLIEILGGYLTVEPEGSDVVTLTGTLTVGQAGVIDLEAELGGTITTTGNISAQIGSFLRVFQDVGQGSQIQIGTGSGNNIVAGGGSTISFNNSEILSDSIVAGTFGSNTITILGTTTAVDTLFTINPNSILFSNNNSTQIDPADVTCNGDAQAYILSPANVNLCIDP